MVEMKRAANPLLPNSYTKMNVEERKVAFLKAIEAYKNQS